MFASVLRRNAIRCNNYSFLSHTRTLHSPFSPFSPPIRPFSTADNNNSQIREDFKKLSAEEKQKVLQHIRESIKKNTDEIEQQQAIADPNLSRRQFIIFLLSFVVSMVAVSFFMGYYRRVWWNKLEGKVVRKKGTSVVYEYSIYGKTFRKVQDIGSNADGLERGAFVTVHYKPENPRHSLIFPPYFYFYSSTRGSEDPKLEKQ